MEQTLKDAQKTSESCDNSSDLKIEKKLLVSDGDDRKSSQPLHVEEVPKVEESSCDIRQDIVVGFDRQPEVLKDTTLGCDTKASEDDIGKVSASVERSKSTIHSGDIDDGSKQGSIGVPHLISTRMDVQLPIVSTEEVKLRFEDSSSDVAEITPSKEDTKVVTGIQGSPMEADAEKVQTSKDHVKPGDIIAIEGSYPETSQEINIERRGISDVRETPICAVTDDLPPGKLGDTVPTGRMDDDEKKSMKVNGIEEKMGLKESAGFSVAEKDAKEKSSEEKFTADIAAKKIQEPVILQEINGESQYLHEPEARDLKTQPDQDIDPKNILEIKIAHVEEDSAESGIRKDAARKPEEKDLKFMGNGSNGLQGVIATKDISVSDVVISSAATTAEESDKLIDEGLRATSMLPGVEKDAKVKEDQISKDTDSKTVVVTEEKPHKDDAKNNLDTVASSADFIQAKENGLPASSPGVEIHPPEISHVSHKLLDDIHEQDANRPQHEAIESVTAIKKSETTQEQPCMVIDSDKSTVKGSGEDFDDRKEKPVHDSKIDAKRDVKVCETKFNEDEFTIGTSHLIPEICREEKDQSTVTVVGKESGIDPERKEKDITEGDKPANQLLMPELEFQTNAKEDPIKEQSQGNKGLVMPGLVQEDKTIVEDVKITTQADESIPTETIPVSTKTSDDHKVDIKPAKEDEHHHVINGEKRDLVDQTPIHVETHQDIAQETPKKDIVQLPKSSDDHAEGDKLKTVKEVEHVVLNGGKPALVVEAPNHMEAHQIITQEMVTKDLVHSKDTLEDLKSGKPELAKETEHVVVVNGERPDHVDEKHIHVETLPDVAKEISRKELVQSKEQLEDLKSGKPGLDKETKHVVVNGEKLDLVDDKSMRVEKHEGVTQEIPTKEVHQVTTALEDLKSDKPADTAKESEVHVGNVEQLDLMDKPKQIEVDKDNAKEVCKGQDFITRTSEDLKSNIPEPKIELETGDNGQSKLVDEPTRPVEVCESNAQKKAVTEVLEHHVKTSDEYKSDISDTSSDIIVRGQSSLVEEPTKDIETHLDVSKESSPIKDIVESAKPSDGAAKVVESDILVGGQSSLVEETTKQITTHQDLPQEAPIMELDLITKPLEALKHSKPENHGEVALNVDGGQPKLEDNQDIEQEVPLRDLDESVKPCDYPQDGGIERSPEKTTLDEAVGKVGEEDKSPLIPTGPTQVIPDITDGYHEDKTRASEDNLTYEDEQRKDSELPQDVIEEDQDRDQDEDTRSLVPLAVDEALDKPDQVEESIKEETENVIQHVPTDDTEADVQEPADMETGLMKEDDKPSQPEESIQVEIISEDQIVKSIKLDLIASGEEETKKEVEVRIDLVEEEKAEEEELTDIGKEGDHDSGVDESTQGKLETADESHDTPTKPLSPRRGTDGPLATDKGKSSIPTSPRSKDVKETSDPSAAAKSPLKTSPKTASATMPAKTPPVPDKKVPMNKVVVGTAPSPNLKVVKSKIGSMQNVKHRPGGGQVKLETKKIDFTSVKPKVGSTDHVTHKPGGGDKKVVTTKLEWKAQSKIGSLENAQHKPGGGEKKIETVKVNFKGKAKPKVGSTDNIKHKPGGGQVQIEEHKLEIKAKAKIGSLDNAQHKPGGGNVQIFDEKTYYNRQESSSKTNSEGHDGSGEQSPDAELSSLQPRGEEEAAANGGSAQ